MSTLYTILVVVHVLCWIGALALINPISSTIRKGASHAVAAALLTGLIIVGLGEMADLRDYNHYKIATKLLVALAATVVAFVGQRAKEPNPFGRIGFGLVAANILIAITW